nr:hypothetical protein [uncultured Sulfurimonas sp.]
MKTKEEVYLKHTGMSEKKFIIDFKNKTYRKIGRKPNKREVKMVVDTFELMTKYENNEISLETFVLESSKEIPNLQIIKGGRIL